jgi:glycogen synthase
MKRARQFANRIKTVSKIDAEEIKTEDHGHDLDMLAYES